jgi:hypothetical protein
MFSRGLWFATTLGTPPSSGTCLGINPLRPWGRWEEYGNQMFPPKAATCPGCGAVNLTDTCELCGRPFVLTQATAEGRTRSFGDVPVQAVPASYASVCDYDRAKDARLALPEVLLAGIWQRTCPVCHSEVLLPPGLQSA